MKKVDTKKIVITALFCSLAYLMTFVCRFKVGFLTFDFKDAIITVCTFLLGPVYGVSSAALVAFIEFISISDTGVYGLIMNFLASGTYALVGGVIYKYKRKFSGAILSVIFASACVILVMLLANIFITPLFLGIGKNDIIIFMGREINGITELVVTILLPFNAAKTIINSAVIMIIYKPISVALRRVKLIESSAPAKFGLKSVLVGIVSIAIIVLVTLFVLLNLHGEFKLF